MSNPNNFKEERFDRVDFNDDVQLLAKDIFVSGISFRQREDVLSTESLESEAKESLAAAMTFYCEVVRCDFKTYMRKRYGKDDELFSDVPWIDENEDDASVGDELGDTTKELETSIKKIVEEDQSDEES